MPTTLFQDGFESGDFTAWTATMQFGNGANDILEVLNNGQAQAGAWQAHLGVVGGDDNLQGSAIYKTFVPNGATNIVDAQFWLNIQTYITNVAVTDGFYVRFYRDAFLTNSLSIKYNYIAALVAFNDLWGAGNSIVQAELRLDALNVLYLIVYTRDGKFTLNKCGRIVPGEWHQVDLIQDLTGTRPMYSVAIDNHIVVQYKDETTVSAKTNRTNDHYLANGFWLNSYIGANFDFVSTWFDVYYDSVQIGDGYYTNKTGTALRLYGQGSSATMGNSASSFGVGQRLAAGTGSPVTVSGIQMQVANMALFDTLRDTAQIDTGVVFAPGYSSAINILQFSSEDIASIWNTAFLSNENSDECRVKILQYLYTYTALDPAKILYANSNTVLANSLNATSWTSLAPLLETGAQQRLDTQPNFTPIRYGYDRALGTQYDNSTLTTTLHGTTVYIGVWVVIDSDAILNIYVDNVLHSSVLLGNKRTFNAPVPAPTASATPFNDIDAGGLLGTPILGNFYSANISPPVHRWRQFVDVIPQIIKIDGLLDIPHSVTLVYNNPTNAFQNSIWVHFFADNTMFTDALSTLVLGSHYTSNGIGYTIADVDVDTAVGEQNFAVSDLNCDGANIQLIDLRPIVNISTMLDATRGMYLNDTGSQTVADTIKTYLNGSTLSLDGPKGTGHATMALARYNTYQDPILVVNAPSPATTVLPTAIIGKSLATMSLFNSYGPGYTPAYSTTVDIPLLGGHGECHESLWRFIPLFRTCLVYGYLLDPSTAPVANATVRAVLNTADQYTVAAAVPYVAVEAVVLSTTTDANGYWSLALIAPQDLAEPAINTTTPIVYTIILDALGLNPAFIQTTSFAYSSPVNIETIIDNTTKTFTAPLVGYIADSQGNPLSNIVVVAALDSMAEYMNPSSITITSDGSVRAATDSNGFYALRLVPTDKLSVSDKYYTVTEGSTRIKKFVQVPSTGGYIWNNLVAVEPVNTNTIPIAQMGADLHEATTFKIPEPGDSAEVNLNNMRNVLTSIYGTSWVSLVNAVPRTIMLNAGATQTGNIAVTGTLATLAVVSPHTGSIPVMAMAIQFYAAAGTDAVVATPTLGNRVNGVISWTSGSANFCPGNQVRVTFGTPYSAQAGIAMQITPGNATAALLQNIRQIYFSIDNTGFTIGFGHEEITGSNTYTFYYSIEGM